MYDLGWKNSHVVKIALLSWLGIMLQLNKKIVVLQIFILISRRCPDILLS